MAPDLSSFVGSFGRAQTKSASGKKANKSIWLVRQVGYSISGKKTSKKCVIFVKRVRRMSERK